jgi:hypothetical protein
MWIPQVVIGLFVIAVFWYIGKKTQKFAKWVEDLVSGRFDSDSVDGIKPNHEIRH